MCLICTNVGEIFVKKKNKLCDFDDFMQDWYLHC